MKDHTPLLWSPGKRVLVQGKGKGKEGCWTAEHLIAQVLDMIDWHEIVMERKCTRHPLRPTRMPARCTRAAHVNVHPQRGQDDAVQALSRFFFILCQLFASCHSCERVDEAKKRKLLKRKPARLPPRQRSRQPRRAPASQRAQHAFRCPPPTRIRARQSRLPGRAAS